MIKNLRFGSELPIHAGRYQLVVSPQCPWCRRTTIARRLLGLDQAIGISVAQGRGVDGFEFISAEHSFDPIILAHTTREIYRREADWAPGDPTTVPLILDLKQGRKIVNHESAQILTDLVTVWKPFWKFKAPDLYPVDRREEIDQFNQWADQELIPALSAVIHGQLTEPAAKPLQAALARLDQQLASAPYLFGQDPTVAEIRVFSHLCSARQVDPTLGQQFSHLEAFYQKHWSDPLWVSAAEREALVPAARSANATDSAKPNSTAAQATAACALPATGSGTEPSAACSL